MQDGGARHAIPTDDAHLDAAAIGGTCDNRNDGVLRKDDVLDRLVWLVNHVAPLQRDHFEVRLDEGQIVRRECSEQGVAGDGRLGVADDGQMRRLRHGSPRSVWAGVHVSLSRLRPGSIDKQWTKYKIKRCKKQRTTIIIISALSDGSSHYLFTDLRPELFSKVDGAKVRCKRPLLCHSRGLRVPHGKGLTERQGQQSRKP